MELHCADSPKQAALVIATSNAGKRAEFRDLLSHVPLEVIGFNAEGASVVIEESGSSYEENATIKATTVAKHIQRWALGDDTGLEVDALGGLPGIRTNRFAGENATAEENRAKLIEQLSKVPIERRSARFLCHLALADPSGEIRAVAVGQCNGRIALEPRGPQSFGYDCLFELLEYHRTLAELGAAAKTCLTHRARAVYRMLPSLISLLGIER